MISRNYLRVRGEYGYTPDTLVMHPELPPRARRIHQRYNFRGIEHGTTSACAENTQWFHHHQSRTQNYLRVRGEYFVTVVFLAGVAELPPRARRILYSGACNTQDIGTTSACAENTLNELGLL